MAFAVCCHAETLRATVQLCVCICMCMCVRARARACGCVYVSAQQRGCAFRSSNALDHRRAGLCAVLPERRRGELRANDHGGAPEEHAAHACHTRVRVCACASVWACVSVCLCVCACVHGRRGLTRAAAGGVEERQRAVVPLLQRQPLSKPRRCRGAAASLPRRSRRSSFGPDRMNSHSSHGGTRLVDARRGRLVYAPWGRFRRRSSSPART